MSTDPNHWITNPPSTFVKVIGTSRETLNGKFGLVVQYMSDKNRYTIILTSPPPEVAATGTNATSTSSSLDPVALKPENLIVCTYSEKMMAQYYLYRYNPEVQKQLQKIYQQIQDRTKMKPEYFFSGIVLCFIVLMYFVGFSRVMLLGSMILLFVTMMGSDLQNGASFKTIVTNVPIRWKQLIQDNIPNGYGTKIVQNKYLYQLFTMLVLFFFLKPLIPMSLLSSSKSTTTTSFSPTDNFLDNTYEGRNSNRIIGLTMEHIEAIYKLGYDDAKPVKMMMKEDDDNEFVEEFMNLPPKEYKTSLPNTIEKIRERFNIPLPTKSQQKVDIGIQGVDNVDDDDNNNNNNDYSWRNSIPGYSNYAKSSSSTSNKSKSPFNLQTGLSLFTMYRLLEPISRNQDGQFDMDLLKANLMTLDIWKLGLIGFSIYRLIAQFL